MDEAANERDYAEKWDHLRALIGQVSLGPGQPVLDAGCGIGFFTRRLAGEGFTVSGLDFSAQAINLARSLDNEGITWHVGALDTFRSQVKYQGVFSIDVLFHIVDDELWARSIRNLADLTSSSGFLIIQEELRDERAPAGGSGTTHVRRRTLKHYLEQLEGWRLLLHDAYVLSAQGTRKDLLCFARSRDADGNESQEG